ncbi:MAG: PLP-dependent aminotransferase family protein [Cellvibrionales bacterium]|jgi:2-aminoadipate transaminase
MVQEARRMQGYGSDFIKEMFAAAKNPDMISFAGGAPAPELYALDAFRAASDKAFQVHDRAIMAYDGAYGVAALREFIASRWMTRTGVHVTADDILILSGSQQGIDYAARLYLDEGDTVIVEHPSYLGALNTFSALRAKYVSVATDAEGMRMDALEEALISNPEAKLIYTVPDFQNPTGITLAADRRLRMVELAEQYDVMIIEDSPYFEIRFEGEFIPSIKSYDKSDRVIYLGSFSKTLCPGIRLGWVVASKAVIERYRVLKEATDFQAGTVAQYQAATFLADFDLDQHLVTSRNVYRARRDAAFAAIEQTFPADVNFTRPEGGYFIWVEAPGINATEMVVYAMNEIGVAYVPGESFYASDPRLDTLRLSYSQMTEDKIGEGIGRLGRLLKEARA